MSSICPLLERVHIISARTMVGDDVCIVLPDFNSYRPDTVVRASFRKVTG